MKRAMIRLHLTFYRHVIIAHKHPHHYVTAGCMTCFCIIWHKFDAAFIYGSWLYAFVETCVSGDEMERIEHLPDPLARSAHLATDNNSIKINHHSHTVH